MLSISRALLYQYLREGRIRASKVDRARLIPVSELERFIAENMENANE